MHYLSTRALSHCKVTHDDLYVGSQLVSSRQQRITLESIATPRTVATDQILRRLGLNFRAGKPALDKDGHWHVPLRVLIPASPDVMPRLDQQLFYRFETFSEIVMDSNLNLISVPR